MKILILMILYTKKSKSSFGFSKKYRLTSFCRKTIHKKLLTKQYHADYSPSSSRRQFIPRVNHSQLAKVSIKSFSLIKFRWSQSFSEAIYASNQPRKS